MQGGRWSGYPSSSGGQSKGNPFLEDDPFHQHASISTDSIPPGVSPGPAAATSAFGSPLSGASVGAASPQGPQSTLQEVPLFDSYSSTTHYETPATSLRSLSATPSTTGAWPSNGRTPASGRASFEVSHSSKSTGKSKSGALGKLWSGGMSGPGVPIEDSPSNLARREADVARREAEVARREGLVASGRVAISNKNWPSRCLRLVHHDINGDVPADRRSLVKMAYFTWWVVALGYVWNFICITTFFIGGQKKVSLWVMAALVAFAGLPLSFLCWYRPLYTVASTDGATRWFWYFLNMLAHIVWCWWMFVGINPNLGGYSAGLFTMIEQFSNGGGTGTAFGVLSVFNMVFFALAGSLGIVVLGRSWSLFRRGPPVPQDRMRV